VDTFFHGVEPNLVDWLERQADAVALYAEHFKEGRDAQVGADVPAPSVVPQTDRRPGGGG